MVFAMNKLIVENRAQGSIEYLLIVGVGILLVATLIVFLSQIIKTVPEDTKTQILENNCGPKPAGLEQNSLACGCYLCDGSKWTRVGGEKIFANATTCQDFWSEQGLTPCSSFSNVQVTS
jgi:hypothetical protein